MRNDIAETIVTVSLSGASDLTAAQLTLRGREDPASLTPAERLMLTRSTDAIWRLRENIYYQYRNGLFDESEFLAESASWAGSFDTPFGREHYCQAREFFSPGFIDLVEGMLSSTDCREIMNNTVLAILGISFVGIANAQGRVECECEYDDWVGECRAEFERQGNTIILKSDTDQCSRIDRYTDAQPRLSVVVNKQLAQELLGIPAGAEISISACNVCKDSRYKAGANDDASQAQSNPVSGSATNSDKEQARG